MLRCAELTNDALARSSYKQNLQNDIKAFQKKAKKDKLSKKDTDAQVQSMESDLEARHEEELASLEVGALHVRAC